MAEKRTLTFLEGVEETDILSCQAPCSYHVQRKNERTEHSSNTQTSFSKASLVIMMKNIHTHSRHFHFYEDTQFLPVSLLILSSVSFHSSYFDSPTPSHNTTHVNSHHYHHHLMSSSFLSPFCPITDTILGMDSIVLHVI